MSNYCSYADVGLLLNKTFNDTTTPTDTQVTSIITQITKEIDAVLKVAGISAQPTDTNILGLLQKHCSFGAAGITGISYFRNASGISGSNAEWYYSKYEEFLKEVKENPDILGISAGSETISVSNPVLDGTITETELKDIILQSGDFEV